MPFKKPLSKYVLVCVAHPDDETLFFAGIIQSITKKIPVHVICMTFDGNLERKKQFSMACKKLKVSKFEFWDLPDVYKKRLPIKVIQDKLRILPIPTAVYTHGPVGDYGHPHHQDVCFAVHEVFYAKTDVFSVAYNSFPDKIYRLTKKDYSTKCSILTNIYTKETNRFLNVLDASYVEGFNQLDNNEVRVIYNYLIGKTKNLLLKKFSKYFWLKNYLKIVKNLKRPF